METETGDFTCRKCGARANINVPAYLMKPSQVVTNCLSRYSFKVTYTGKRPFLFNYSLCDNCLREIKKSQSKGDLILLVSAVILTIILFFVLPRFRIPVLAVGGVFSLGFLVRLSDSFGSGVKFLKKHIGRKNSFSMLHFKLDDGTEAQSFNYKYKDTNPIGGGGKTYTDFKENAYLVFTDDYISLQIFEKMIGLQEYTSGSVTFEFTE
jgi:hypothetical protein